MNVEPGNPWYFRTWVYTLTIGNPIRKAVLSNLAHMADATTGRCEAKQATIAQAVEVSERAVRGHLKALEEDGYIARRAQHRWDGGRRGDEFLLLAPDIDEWPDGRPVDRPRGGGDDEGDARNVVPGGPERDGGGPRHGGAAQEQPPSNDHVSRQEKSASAKKTKADAIPDGFPDALRPHARVVMRVLRDVAEHQPNARAVTARAVALAIMGHPRKPLVASAYALASWAATAPRPVKDVVATYRTWLAREGDLAATETLDGDAPGGAAPAPSGNVTRLHDRRGGAAADRRAERDRMDAEENAALERLRGGGA